MYFCRDAVGVRRNGVGEMTSESSLVLPLPSALRNSNSQFPPNVIAVGGERQWCCVVSTKEEPRGSGRGTSALQQQPCSSSTTGARGSIAGLGATNGVAEFSPLRESVPNPYQTGLT